MNQSLKGVSSRMISGDFSPGALLAELAGTKRMDSEEIEQFLKRPMTTNFSKQIELTLTNNILSKGENKASGKILLKKDKRLQQGWFSMVFYTYERSVLMQGHLKAKNRTIREFIYFKKRSTSLLEKLKKRTTTIFQGNDISKVAPEEIKSDEIKSDEKILEVETMNNKKPEDFSPNANIVSRKSDFDKILKNKSKETTSLEKVNEFDELFDKKDLNLLEMANSLTDHSSNRQLRTFVTKSPYNGKRSTRFDNSSLPQEINDILETEIKIFEVTRQQNQGGQFEMEFSLDFTHPEWFTTNTRFNFANSLKLEDALIAVENNTGEIWYFSPDEEIFQESTLSLEFSIQAKYHNKIRLGPRHFFPELIKGLPSMSDPKTVINQVHSDPTQVFIMDPNLNYQEPFKVKEIYFVPIPKKDCWDHFFSKSKEFQLQIKIKESTSLPNLFRAISNLSQKDEFGVKVVLKLRNFSKTYEYKFFDMLLFANILNFQNKEQKEFLAAYLMVPLEKAEEVFDSKGGKAMKIVTEFPLSKLRNSLSKTQTIHLKVWHSFRFYLSSRCMNFKHFVGEKEVNISNSGIGSLPRFVSESIENKRVLQVLERESKLAEAQGTAKIGLPHASVTFNPLLGINLKA